MKNGFLKVLKNEVKNMFEKPRRLFYALIFPVIIFGFLSALFYDEVPRELPVAYIDYDQTQGSNKLVRMFDSSPTIKLIFYSDINEARKALQQEKIYGIIEIPNNFQSNFFKGFQNEVICYTNNQFILPAGLIQKEFQQIIGTYSAGLKINKATQNDKQLDQAIVLAQPILLDEHQLYNPYNNYAFYLLTAFFPMMLHMIVIMVTIYIIGIEFKHKTATNWYIMSDKNPFKALYGKLLPYTLCLFFVGWWMNYLLFVRIGAPLKTGMINVVLMTFLLIIVYQAIGVIITSMTNNFRSALTLGSGFTAIAFSFTAYTFPIEGLPKSIQLVSDFFPLKHFLNYYVNRAIKGISIEYSWQSIVALAAFTVIFFICAPLFVKRLKAGGYE